MSKQSSVQKEIGVLCQTSPDGEILKSSITSANYKRLKSLLKTLEIEVVKNSKRSFSYRQYCKLFSSYVFKNSKCGSTDQICCQAITGDGVRCHRPASKFLTIDLTEMQILPTIPSFVKAKLGPLKTEKLKLIGFANTCCFYCWQHAGMYALEGTTFASNYSYYLTHPEDILGIFFEEVSAKKVGRVLTYSVSASKLRSAKDIVKNMYKTSGDIQGKTSYYYWGVFITLYAYDTIQYYLGESLSGSDTESITESMAVTAADALLYANNA